MYLISGLAANLLDQFPRAAAEADIVIPTSPGNQTSPSAEGLHCVGSWPVRP